MILKYFHNIYFTTNISMIICIGKPRTGGLGRSDLPKPKQMIVEAGLGVLAVHIFHTATMKNQPVPFTFTYGGAWRS